MGKALVIKGADFSNVAVNVSEQIIATKGTHSESGNISTSNYRAYIRYSGIIGDEIHIVAPTGFSFTGWNADSSWSIVGNKISPWQTEYSVVLTTGNFVINIAYGNHTESDTFTQEMLNNNPFNVVEF